MGRPSRGYRLRELPGGAWQVRFSHAGKRWEVSTEELELDRAEAQARQIYSAVISGRWIPGSTLAKPGTLVKDIGPEWLMAIEPMADRLTLRQYGYYVTAHWHPHFKTLDGMQSPALQAAYVRNRLRAVKRKTLQKELSAMRNFLGWAHEVGHLPERVDIAKLTVKSVGTPDTRLKHKSVAIELSMADVEAILAQLPEMSSGGPTSKPFAVRDYFIALYETGLRPSTIERLEVADLRGGFRLAIREEIDKARFGREVDLTVKAQCAFNRSLPFGHHVDRRRHLKVAAVLAGKPGVSAYDFRHARATHLMEASGNNILGVGYLLGHTQATTTNKYAKQTQRAAKEVLGMIGNATVRKEGFEPSPEVIGQEPERSAPVSLQALSAGQRPSETPANGSQRHEASEFRVRLVEPRWPHELPFGVTVGDVEADLAARVSS